MTLTGIMMFSTKGFAVLTGLTAYIAYLAQSFKGPESPKYQVDPEFANLAKLYQPGIVPEHYYDPKKL